MAKSQETFNKKEKEKKRLKKKQEKLERKLAKKENKKTASFEDMIAYVDQDGNLVDEKPDPAKRKKVIAENIDIGVPKREKVESLAVRTGRVEFFNDQKGFGFIKETGSEEKFFVHVHGLIDEIKENDLVSFELERGMKGMNAVRVKIVKDKPAPPPSETASNDEEE